MQSEQLNYIPVFMQLLLAVGFVVAVIIISGKLGPKRSSENKDKNFECGIESLYPWAVNFKELGIEGMIKMIIFMLLLLVGFFYIIKKKGLEWE